MMIVGSSVLPTGVDGLSLPSWWEEIRHNKRFEYGAFIGLAFAYAIIAFVALIQLMRISRRVPQYGWTTQKVFHLLNVIVCGLRAVVMAFRCELQDIHDTVLRLMLNDLPGLLFFTTYTLLVLFWAEIYHQAKGQSTAKLRPTFLVTNIFVYAVQVTLLVLSAYPPVHKAAVLTASWFLVVVSMAAALGFMVYGGRLVAMLCRFPLESRGRTKKMHEVGTVTVICTLCFLARAVFIVLATVDRKYYSLNVLGHPLLNITFYSAVEIVPSALVLFILRKLPPKQPPQSAHTVVYAPQDSVQYGSAHDRAQQAADVEAQ
eukprot:jgi/Ulvmu1/6261/UM028_0119.1